MYKIGDYYEKNGLKGIFVSIDIERNIGLIMSLEESACNWYDAQKWCKGLGDGWFMPHMDDFEKMKGSQALFTIQHSLIRHGMPLCFGDEDISGSNRQGHLYWTNNTQPQNEEWCYVFCICPEGFSGFSTDYKTSSFEYIRAMHTVELNDKLSGNESIDTSSTIAPDKHIDHSNNAINSTLTSLDLNLFDRIDAIIRNILKLP